MKSSRILSLIALTLALVAGGVGCKHKAVGVTDLGSRKISTFPGGRNATPDDPGRSFSTGEPPVSSNPVPGDISQKGSRLLNDPNHREDRTALAAQTVYFDLDSSTIKSSEKSKLEEVVKFLQSNPTYEVMVEGHCDERGTEGYNLSLGERRALAIREELITLGVSMDRVNTISYGESRPAEKANNEAAWKKNRRGEFLVLMPAS